MAGGGLFFENKISKIYVPLILRSLFVSIWVIQDRYEIFSDLTLTFIESLFYNKEDPIILPPFVKHKGNTFLYSPCNFRDSDYRKIYFEIIFKVISRFCKSIEQEKSLVSKAFTESPLRLIFVPSVMLKILAALKETNPAELFENPIFSL